MAKNNYMIVSMDDPRLENISEILRNSTCKKIIDYLSEHSEASEKDIADGIKMRLNTVGYNVKKLLQSGFIQKRKNFFWSKKGKKISMYEISNKSILISPKTSVGEKVKSIVPAFLLTLAGSFAIYVYEKVSSSSVQALDLSKEAFAASAPTLATNTSSAVSSSPFWLWFLIGGILALGIFSLVNWRKL